jgi:hypothetical protein
VRTDYYCAECGKSLTVEITKFLETTEFLETEQDISITPCSCTDLENNPEFGRCANCEDKN